MSFRYAGSLAALILAALVQSWGMSVLLLTRQTETLMFGGIIACVFWSWCCWTFFLNKRRLGQALTGFCLFATVVLLAMCLLDMLDETGIHLLSPH